MPAICNPRVSSTGCTALDFSHNYCVQSHQIYEYVVPLKIHQLCHRDNYKRLDIIVNLRSIIKMTIQMLLVKQDGLSSWNSL